MANVRPFDVYVKCTFVEGCVSGQHSENERNRMDDVVDCRKTGIYERTIYTVENQRRVVITRSVITIWRIAEHQAVASVASKGEKVH